MSNFYEKTKIIDHQSKIVYHIGMTNLHDTSTVEKNKENNVINQEADSLLANLLATENITLFYDKNINTAFFDLKKRELHLPIFSDLKEEEKFMWIIHEIGHALFSPPEEYGQLVENAKDTGKNLNLFLDIINVLEDYRIEKLLKLKYKGAEKILFKGMKTILLRPEFSSLFTREKYFDLNFNLIDRINIFSKTHGLLFFDVPEDIKEWIDKVIELKTFSDVKELAEILYEKVVKSHQNNFLALNYNQNKETTNEKNEQKNNESKFVSNPNDNQESLDVKNINLANQCSNIQKALDSLKQSSNSSKLKQFENYNTVLISIDEYNFKDYLVSTEEFVQSTQSYLYKDPKNIWKRDIELIKQKVNTFVQEFSLKKNANNFAKETHFLSGELDENLLYSYKLNDKLFKEYVYSPQQKNHGLVIFLDMSGSIKNIISFLTMKVLTLLLFCEKVNIPYVVYGFTTNYRSSKTENEKERKSGRYDPRENIFYVNGNSEDFTRCFGLVELFNSNKPFAKKILVYSILKEGAFSFSDTPLFQAKMCVPSIYKYYKNLWNTEKIHFIFLTDGDDTSILRFFKKTYIQVYYNGKKVPITLNPEEFYNKSANEVFNSFTNKIIKENIDESSKLLGVLINHNYKSEILGQAINNYDTYIEVYYNNFFYEYEKRKRTNIFENSKQRKISNLLIKKIIDIIA